MLVEQGFLLHPNREKRLYPVEAIETFDWSDIDIKRESQGAERDPRTVQYRSIAVLSAEADWEIVLDDDGSGELADIILIRRAGLLALVWFSVGTATGGTTVTAASVLRSLLEAPVTRSVRALAKSRHRVKRSS